MPRVLISYGCSLEDVTVRTLKIGDLLFLKKKSSQRSNFKKCSIVHIMIVVDHLTLFHSSTKRNGGFNENFIETVDTFPLIIPSRVINHPFLFLRYIDPRNKRLKDEYNQEFIPFAIPRPLIDNSWLAKTWRFLRINISQNKGDLESQRNISGQPMCLPALIEKLSDL